MDHSEATSSKPAALHALPCAQVCLAAETCGHLKFNARTDMWYSSEPFHCGDEPPGEVSYMDIFKKVRSS